jgi:hypothetical protein
MCAILVYRRYPTMSTEKVQVKIYMTETARDQLRERASELGLTVSAYISECTMWERREDLIPRLRRGSDLRGK